MFFFFFSPFQEEACAIHVKIIVVPQIGDNESWFKTKYKYKKIIPSKPKVYLKLHALAEQQICCKFQLNLKIVNHFQV